MKVNKWTMGLAAVGLVSLPSLVQADEKIEMSPLNTALSSTTISGYVSTSMQWNPGTGNANAPKYAYGSGKQDGFNLDAVKLSIERPLNEDTWSAGYKVDLFFGPDAATLATGDNIKQAYVLLRAPVGNGLDFKVGVFDTIIGYESTDSGSNPNYTRSYGYTLEPTTHTGVLGSYQFNEMFGASFGMADTVGPTINGRAAPARAESYKTYMGSVAFKAPSNLGFLEGSTLYAGVIKGYNPSLFGTGTSGNQVNLYFGGTLNTPIKELKVGASYDYVALSKIAGAGVGYANAAALYVSYQLSEKLTLHNRFEYSSLSPDIATVAAISVPNKVIAYTLTAQYDLWKNVISRLEFRWDRKADGNTEAFGGTVAGSGNRRNAYLVAANFIYKF